MSNLPKSAVENGDSKNQIEPWRGGLIYKDAAKKIVRPESDLNVKLYIENHPRYCNMFKLDQFSYQKILVRCPPWDNPENFKVRSVRDSDIFCLKCDLETIDLQPTISTVRAAVDYVAHNNQINPPKEWFESLKWDGKKRLDLWLITYLGATQDNVDYVKAIGAKWLIAGVKRVFEPGCKFDQCLVLESAQGAGKSTALRTLATINGVSYFDDTLTIPDLADGKMVPKLQGILILELQELAKFSAEADVLKKSLSTSHDRIIRKYENEPTLFPRQFIIAGSHNPFDGYLHDPTGNRRFWPVAVADTIDIERLKRDVEQLWAEAVARYKNGESVMLDPSMYGLAKAAQEGREIEDIWTDKIMQYTTNQDQLRINDIMDNLGIPFDRRDQKTARRFGSVLRRNGYIKKSVRNNGLGKTETIWVKAGRPEQLELKEEEVKW